MAGPLTQTAQQPDEEAALGAVVDPDFWKGVGSNLLSGASNLTGAATNGQFWKDSASNVAHLLNPNAIPTTPGLPSTDQMASMPFDALFALRKTPGLSQSDHNYIGPYEHRAFMREREPGSVYGALQNVVLNVGYTPWKATFGAGTTRSQPSWNELAQGFHGAWEGLNK